ncbi:MAG: flagellar basal body-associated FliL family protein [Deltaproteobacteria bacterium]|nr:flagellar basal body-associated FliL family protein [Deltaproteobacteria bacterium]
MAAEEKEEAQPTTSAAGLASASSNKLQMILIIANTVATLGMAFILVISHIKNKNTQSVTDIAVESHSEGEAGKASEGGGHGEGAAHGEGEKSSDKKGIEFGKMVTLEQFTINLATVGTVNPKFARVNISVEVPGEDIENELNQKMPQVRNAVIDLFNSKKPADLATSEGRDYLKEEIKKALNDFLVTGKVKGVYFTNFAVSG